MHKPAISAILKDKLLFLMKPQNHHLKTIKLIKRFHILTNIFIKFIYSKTTVRRNEQKVTDVYNLPIMGPIKKDILINSTTQSKKPKWRDMSFNI